MPELKWQKSSYSGSGQNDCVEVAGGAHAGGLRMRESEEPAKVLAPGGATLRAMLAHLKAGGGSRIR
ncbi:hypothetical protein N566_27010 [Streptomycetaceae bacterium MP113-05]|nr:hypothetical protein N566_27010 [Streptomycetaceae bacterium MP113-05]